MPMPRCLKPLIFGARKTPAMRLPFIILLVLSLAQCSDPGQDAGSEQGASRIINPNGDSELALLMRRMFDDGMAMKAAIETGREPEFGYDPQAIFTAHATEPEKAASQEYHDFGQAYLASVKAFQSASPEERKAFYTGMVQSCMACHEQLCPGPTRKIKRMYFEE
jgi:hypothetical protein